MNETRVVIRRVQDLGEELYKNIIDYTIKYKKVLDRKKSF